MATTLTNAPFVTPCLDGTFDCHYILRKGTNRKPISKNFATQAEAQRFAENQHCVIYYNKIDSFLDSLNYLKFSYSGTYEKMTPFIRNVRVAIDQLTPSTNRAEFAEILSEGVICNLMQLRGRNNTNTHAMCQRLIDKLHEFVKAYKSTEVKALDFSVLHQL